LRQGEVEAVREGGGVGVGELDEAVGVGHGGAPGAPAARLKGRKLAASVQRG